MKSRVRINNDTFVVEIKNLDARPIRAVVDGVELEIWPEEIVDDEGVFTTAPKARKSTPAAKPIPKKPVPAVSSARQVTAPIPGLINALNVVVGDTVKVGQQLCVLEAMKMNNSIRASREGVISKVHVSVGQQVKHHQVLFEFAE